MAASEFTLDSVKEFMLSHGGRVKNHELVTHFKVYLNDPERKGAPYYNFNMSKIANRPRFLFLFIYFLFQMKCIAIGLFFFLQKPCY